MVILDWTVERPPYLELVDTEKVVGGAPIRKSFHLSLNSGPLAYPFLLLEQGMYKPSPAETLAPFYQDPTQRIAALCLPDYFAFRVEALLELAESYEGSEVSWNEWKGLVVTPYIGLDRLDICDPWVSGCRLFCITSPDSEMRVFDFSIQGRAEYLSERADVGLGEVRGLLPTDARARIPQSGFLDTHNGHDSIVFTSVSITSSRSILGRRLSGTLRVAAQWVYPAVDIDEPGGDECVSCIWTF